MKNYLVLIGIILLIVTQAIAQTNQDFLHPKIWLKADKLNGSNTFWYDHSGNNNHACILPDSNLPSISYRNYNPVFTFNGNQSPFHIKLDLQNKAAMTMITVYNTSDPQTENGVWSIRKDSIKPQVLTTQKISGENIKYTYRNINDTSLLVNTYCFSINNSRITTPLDEIIIGGTERYNLHGQLAEFIYYPFILSDKELHIIQSYLCLKYGVRLQGSFYLNSKVDTLWSNVTNVGFNCSVIGLGKDTLTGLNQKQSKSSTGNDIVTLGVSSIAESNQANTSQISEGDFLLCGSNNLGLNILWEDSAQTTGLLQRQWLVEATGNTVSSLSTCLELDLSSVLEDSMFVWLAICRDQQVGLNLVNNEYYLADSITPFGKVYFKNIHWDVDHNGKDLFTVMFERQIPPLQSRPLSLNKSIERIRQNPVTQELVNNLNVQKADNGTLIQGNSNLRQDIYLLYPNPTQGDFTLEVHLEKSSWLKIDILDSKGQSLEMITEPEKCDFLIQGNIKTPGNYYIGITTDKEHKALPFIVQ